MESIKIAIVGAGYAGLSACWHLLQKRAVEITLFDGHGIGAGASGASTGLLHPYPAKSARLSHRAYEAMEESFRLIEVAEKSSFVPMASRMFISENKTLFNSACSFFDKLIEYGKKDEILPIKTIILNICTTLSENASLGFYFCDKIVTRHAEDADLINIPLEAALKACRLEQQDLREKSFALFYRLLNWAPERSLPVLIEGILIEAKRPFPCIAILHRIHELIDEESHKLSFISKKIVQNYWREYSPILLIALKHLSECQSAYIRGQAIIMKENLQNRLELREPEGFSDLK